MKKYHLLLFLLILIFVCMPKVEATGVKYDKICKYFASASYDEHNTFFGDHYPPMSIEYFLQLTYVKKNSGRITMEAGYSFLSPILNRTEGRDLIKGSTFDYYVNKAECPKYVYAVACPSIDYRIRGTAPIIGVAVPNKIQASDTPNPSLVDLSKEGEKCRILEFSNPTKTTGEEIDAIIAAGGSGINAISDVICPFCIETFQTWRFIGYLILFLKIAVPILLIVMGILDYGKAVVGGEDQLKKSSSIFIKRIISGIIIFFIPTIVNLVFNLLDDYGSISTNIASCTECLFSPTGSTCEEMNFTKSVCVDEYLATE